QSVPKGLLGLRQVAIDVERPPIPVRIVEHHVLELIEGRVVGLRSTDQATPEQLGARLVTRKDLRARARAPRRAKDRPDRLNLLRRQAPGSVAFLAGQAL